MEIGGSHGGRITVEGAEGQFRMAVGLGKKL
jgi:hypothetical protein